MIKHTHKKRQILLVIGTHFQNLQPSNTVRAVVERVGSIPLPNLASAAKLECL